MPDPWLTDFFLFASGFMAGGINALAGGGSFLAFPALMFVGVPAINANATCTLALLPGAVASIWPYRTDLDAERSVLLTMIIISLTGGLVGAIILLTTPPGIFTKLIPYLLLTATLIFAFGSKITGKILAHRLQNEATSTKPPLISAILQFAIAVYGGYFGAGIGIVMLACLSLLGITKMNAMNALKVLLASVINGVAALVFIAAGAIYWPQVSIMAIGSILGGYLAAKVGRTLPASLLKKFVVFIGSVLTIIFFFKT